ncbi:MAG: ADP-ribosylglycohydrolase family protein [Candidatus Microsaccharimonas sp.]
MTTNVEKAEGMFVGLAVGDALGAPVEFGYSSRSIRRKWDGQMHDHRLPKGHYTDDTAMALCLADSLIEQNGYDSYDVMDRYTRWVLEGYRDSEGMPASDVGNQTRSAIRAYLTKPVVYADTERGYGAGNGGIMRIAPAVIVMANKSIEQTMSFARVSSRETHYSEIADAAAEVFGSMLWNALHIEDKEDITNAADYSTGEVYDDIVSKVNKTKNLRSEPNLRDLGGYVVDAIKIASWGFLNFDSFERGMLAVIKLGGDTDTNGAIYGQLAGAYYGYEAIPEKWRSDLYKRDEIKDLASRLMNLESEGVLRTRFEEDGIGIFESN